MRFIPITIGGHANVSWTGKATPEPVIGGYSEPTKNPPVAIGNLFQSGHVGSWCGGMAFDDQFHDV